MDRWNNVVGQKTSYCRSFNVENRKNGQERRNPEKQDRHELFVPSGQNRT